MNEEFIPVNKSGRPPMRPTDPATSKAEEDPVARAARRAAELRSHDDMTETTDEYFIEPGIIPQGWSYEWKRKTVLGAEDPAHQVALARRGWEIVPASRHPEMMPLGYTGVEITRKGMVLMERPLEITEEVRAAELRKARLQVRAKEEQLTAAPQGQFERSNKGNDLVKVKKGYEAMPIPEE
jgi:hypothetical protein